MRGRWARLGGLQAEAANVLGLLSCSNRALIATLEVLSAVARRSCPPCAGNLANESNQAPSYFDPLLSFWTNSRSPIAAAVSAHSLQRLFASSPLSPRGPTQPLTRPTACLKCLRATGCCRLRLRSSWAAPLWATTSSLCVCCPFLRAFATFEIQQAAAQCGWEKGNWR